MSCGNSLWPFQAEDFEGVWVRWEKRGYDRHVAKRPETDSWHEAMRLTLGVPGLVVTLPDGSRGYYRRGVLGPPYSALYMFIVVRWTGALGDIATAFVTDRVKPYESVVKMEKR